MPVPDYLLSESATGYALYEVTESEEIGARTREFLETINDISRFSKFVKLVSFVPFKNAAQALENINDVSEGREPPPSPSPLASKISSLCRTI
jgi:nucleolar protein 56